MTTNPDVDNLIRDIKVLVCEGKTVTPKQVVTLSRKMGKRKFKNLSGKQTKACALIRNVAGMVKARKMPSKSQFQQLPDAARMVEALLKKRRKAKA